MILQENYDQCTIRTKVLLKCDYCGEEFYRVKKSIPRLNKIIDKDSCGSKNCTKAKQEDVNLKTVGSKCIFTSTSFKEKQKSTNLEKYGTEEYYSSEDFKNKRKKKLLEQYGVESPLQCEEIKEKQRKTCSEKYGVKNYAQAEDFLEKYKKTSLEKYGNESPMQNKKVLHKRDETCLERYGKKNYSQTDEYWQQRKETCLEKYGFEHPHQNKDVITKFKNTNLERYGVENYAQSAEFKKRYEETCLRKYGVPSTLCLKENQKYGRTQIEIQDWLNSHGFNFKSSYKILKTKQLDMFDENLNLGIEYCGLFWHNELSLEPRDRKYHYEKYRICKESGIQLITIFEDEWKKRQEQCKNILLSNLKIFSNRIFARKCSIVESTRKDFNIFCEKYHLQGSNNLGLVFYCLVYKNEIIGGMSLGRHPRNKKLTLDRLFFKNGVQVVGGASKLLKYCKEWAIQNGYNSIISWSDNRWSLGTIYDKLGFVLEEELREDYCYVNFHKPTRRHSKQSQRKALTNCPPGLTEREWAAQNGLARIWDCGKKRWRLDLNN